KKECVDPRFQYVERGCAKYVEWLGIQENPKGKGWAAGSGYGSKILNIMEAITGIKEEQPKPAPAPQPKPEQTGTYKVQAGSYKDKKLANSLAAVLKDKGFETIVKEEAGQYKVQCGAFSNKGNATALADKIKGAGFDAIVKGTESSIWVGKCTGDGVNVRKGPGNNYGNITGYPKLNSGNLVDVINKEDGWYQILIDKKYSGFIAEQYIEKA
ncbi:SPOR domain-containing protein, partial [Robinsoniella peoriensis]|uniref:SPOR domain-containing protein n=1 Tax=Robinsoniella peoriensis TaxID=180332 RepID=UPI0037528180